MLYPRVAPGADGDLRLGRRHGPGHRQAHHLDHHPGAARPPHAVRARRRPARAQDPDHLAPTSAAASATRSASTPATCCAVVGSIVTGKPVKWVEDRSENLMSTAFARDYHMHGEIAATRDGKILGLRVDVLADHGAFNGTAQPTKFPAGFFHIFTGSLRLRRPRTARSPASTPTRRPAASRTPARSASPRPCTSSSAWSTAWPTSSAWTRPSCG